MSISTMKSSKSCSSWMGTFFRAASLWDSTCSVYGGERGGRGRCQHSSDDSCTNSIDRLCSFTSTLHTGYSVVTSQDLDTTFRLPFPPGAVFAQPIYYTHSHCHTSTNTHEELLSLRQPVYRYCFLPFTTSWTFATSNLCGFSTIITSSKDC